MYCSYVWDNVNWFSPARVFHMKWSINCCHIWRLPSGESAIQESVEQLEPSSSNPAWYWILFKVGIGCINVEGGCTSRPNSQRHFCQALYWMCCRWVSQAFIHAIRFFKPLLETSQQDPDPVRPKRVEIRSTVHVPYCILHVGTLTEKKTSCKSYNLRIQ